MDRDAAIALLEANHSFPSDHSFHVIVRQPDIDTVSAAIATYMGLPYLHDRMEQVPSSKGTYVSLRLALPCESAAVVLDMYNYLTTIPQVVRYF